MNAADAFDFFHPATARPIYLGYASWLSFPVGRAYALNSFRFVPLAAVLFCERATDAFDNLHLATARPS